MSSTNTVHRVLSVNELCMHCKRNLSLFRKDSTQSDVTDAVYKSSKHTGTICTSDFNKRIITLNL